MSTRALRITAVLALLLASAAMLCSMQAVTSGDQQARALALGLYETFLALPLLALAAIPGLIAGGAGSQGAWQSQRRGWAVVLVLVGIAGALAPVGAFEGLLLADADIERGIAVILASHGLALLSPVLVLIYASTQPVDAAAT